MDDLIQRQAVLEAIDVKAWEFCDYLISKNRNDEQKPVSHFADNLRECVREELPSVKQESCEDANANQHNSNALNDVGQHINALEVDAISRQAVIDALYDIEVIKYRIDIENVIKALPSVKPQEKTGHWIYKTMEGQFCSICGEQSVWKFNYCPNCGCRMVDEQESEG